MRIISFSKKWGKLNQLEFTTFRFPRKDKDWYAGEMVQVYYKNRTPQRERLGLAEISNKESRKHADISHLEAIVDGFHDLAEMDDFLGLDWAMDYDKVINKLTLTWLEGK